jgi:hypothetical protein
VLQYHFNWKVISAAAGITWWNFYFRLYPKTIRSAQVIDFLGHLLRHLRGKLLVLWDGLPGTPGARGERLHSRTARPARHRVAAELRTGTQSGRVHLGLLEAPRFTQLLPARFRSAQPPGLPRPTPHAPTSAPHPILLASSSIVTIICRTQ